jgi:glutamate-1-semialdehyde aminotransferase
MISTFLTTDSVEALHEYRDVRRHCDFERYIKLQHFLQRRGVYFHPNQFEPMFPSTAHTASEIDIVLERFGEAVECCLAPRARRAKAG